jgi:hypothetical protein
MTYLSIKNNQERIHNSKEDKGIEVPPGTICFMLGKTIQEEDGLVPNNFRETDLYDIKTECSLHTVYNKSGSPLFQSLKIHEIRFFIENEINKK